MALFQKTSFRFLQLRVCFLLSVLQLARLSGHCSRLFVQEREDESASSFSSCCGCRSDADGLRSFNRLEHGSQSLHCRSCLLSRSWTLLFFFFFLVKVVSFRLLCANTSLFIRTATRPALRCTCPSEVYGGGLGIFMYVYMYACLCMLGVSVYIISV